MSPDGRPAGGFGSGRAAESGASGRTRPLRMANMAAAPRVETPILAYVCSMWELTVLGDTDSRRAISLVGSPLATSTSTSASLGVSPAGNVGRRRDPTPAQCRTASTASPSRRPALTSPRSNAIRSLTGQAAAMGPIVPHRVVHVRGRDDPGRERDRSATQTARIAAAVETLVMEHRDCTDLRQLGLAAQHALGQVRVGANPLQLGRDSPSLSQIPLDTPITPRSWTSPARSISLVSRRRAVRLRPPPTPAPPTPREWPRNHADLRSA